MMMDCDGSYVLCFIVHAMYRNTTDGHGYGNVPSQGWSWLGECAFTRMSWLGECALVKIVSVR